MAAGDELPIIEVRDQAAWEHWLEQHHDTVSGAWLKFAKKGAPATTVTYAQAVEGALCFGWIDGQSRRLDEHFYLQRFTPRRRRSKWSQINVQKAEALVAAGRMRPAGLAEMEAARADGRWADAYPPASEAPVPDDLQRALDADPAARQFFESLTGSRRYAFLYRLHAVKRPEARRQRIAAYVELLARGETLTD